MRDDFDPRIWNLFAGVALLSAGCGARVAGQEAGETAETTAEGPECTSASDCPYGYSCSNGVCMYYPQHDGWIPYYECYSDSECPDFELCEFGYCEWAGELPGDCEPASVAVGIPVEGEALALSFADVDGDGQDELIVATDSSLLCYEPDGSPPTVSMREAGAIVDMVAGSFDATPGEDLLLLLDSGVTAAYGSNGDGSFGAPSAGATPVPMVVGLIAGDFDGQPPTDLLGWGPAGAYVERGGVTTLLELSVDAAAALELGSTAPGYYLRRETTLDIFDLELQDVTSNANLGGAPFDIAAYVGVEGPAVASINHYEEWSLIRVYSALTAARLEQWPIPGLPEQVLAGDLDGDGRDELVFNSSVGLAIQFDPTGPESCWDTPIWLSRGVPRGVAFGDHDGDGDQELAILSSLGEVELLDGG